MYGTGRCSRQPSALICALGRELLDARGHVPGGCASTRRRARPAARCRYRTADRTSKAQCVITSTGTPVGGIKHVWLIILENKSYDETFTGLNQNSYLWQTLPQQGALLTNYYGTGHFSMDNYISLVSGQSPSYAVQDDCSTTANMTNNNSGIITNGHGRHRYRHRRHHRQLGHQHQRPRTPTGSQQRQLRPAAGPRRGRRLAGQQRLRLPDRRGHPVQPVQRGRRLLEGLRPGPRWRPAHRLDDLRHRLHARRHRHRARP